MMSVFVFAGTSTVTIQGGANELRSYIGSGKYTSGSQVDINAFRKSSDGTFGWYKGEDLASSDVDYKFTASDDVTYTPIGTYSIAYDLNGGDWSSTAGKTSYTSQDSSYTLPTPVRTGYTFNGWTGSNGSTEQSSITINAGETGNKSYTANWTLSLLIADSYIQKDNIISFINNNKNTTQSIAFQGSTNGKFYVKAGSFTNGSNPNLASSGTLIYDAGGADKGAALDNYKCAAHLANVMNYILYNTKGSSYGSNDAKFADSPTSSSDTELNSSAMPKGFYYAYGVDSNFSCLGRGYTGYSRNNVYSNSDNAVWW